MWRPFALPAVYVEALCFGCGGKGGLVISIVYTWSGRGLCTLGPKIGHYRFSLIHRDQRFSLTLWLSATKTLHLLFASIFKTLSYPLDILYVFSNQLIVLKFRSVLVSSSWWRPTRVWIVTWIGDLIHNNFMPLGVSWNHWLRSSYLSTCFLFWSFANPSPSLSLPIISYHISTVLSDQRQ